MSLKIERITETRQLRQSTIDQWKRLPQPSPMQSPEWLLAWWREFRTEADRLCLMLAWDGEQLVGLAPWYVTRSRSTSCIRFLGDGLVCSDHATIALRDDFQDAVVSSLADWLNRQAGIVWHSVHFESVDSEDGLICDLIGRLASVGYASHQREVAGCWTVQLPATWDEYLSGLSKNFRKRCRRWHRTYFETGRAEIIRVASSGIQEAWDLLSELNRERRLHVGDRSAFTDDRFHRFHLAALRDLVDQRRAELRILRVDGESVAAEYILVQDATIFCYQSGMKTSDNRDGFGNLSLLALFRDAIEDGFTQLDFLRGDEDYKTHWGGERGSCVDHHLAAKSFAGTAQINCVRVLDWMRAVRSSFTPSSAS